MTTNSPTEAQREQFEKIACEFFDWKEPIPKYEDNYEVANKFRNAWYFWQAALSSQPRMMEHEGYVLVPSEPTVAMVEAAFKSIQMWNKVARECVKLWAPKAGKRHPHEPGIVAEIRAAIAEGAKLPKIVKE